MNFGGLRLHDDSSLGIMSGDVRNGVTAFTTGQVQYSPSGALYGPVKDNGNVLEVTRTYLYVKRCL